MKQLVAKPVARFDELAPGWKLISVSVDWSGNPVLLFGDEKELGDRFGVPENADSLPPLFRKKDLVCHRDRGSWRKLHLEHGERNLAFAQPLPDQDWLLVESTLYQEREHNACRYSREGTLTGSFTLGDAIENLQTTGDGRIWVGYFDEGICDGQLGSAGAACFDLRGTQLFDYQELARVKALPRVDDCYAMNVSTLEDTWLYYYSDFPVVRLKDFELERIWQGLPVGGAKAFALGRDGNLVLAGGYINTELDELWKSAGAEGVAAHTTKAESLFVLNLNSMQCAAAAAVNPQGKPIAFGRAVGRGSDLFLETSDELFVVDCSGISA